MKKKAFALFSLCALVGASVWANPVEKLSRQLTKGLSKPTTKKIAVMSFPYHDSKLSSGSSIVAERLTTSLVEKRGVQVIERRLIKKILQEQKLSETGVIDPASAKQVGSILGVDAIVTGSLIDLENGKTEVNARLIDSKTGEILSAGHQTIDRTWSDKPRLPPVPAVAAPPPPAPVPEPEVEEVPAEPLNAIKLSNENFPPGRRKYHAPEKPVKEDKAKKTSGDYEYSTGYSDGYYDATVNKSKTQKTAPAKIEEKSLIDKRLEEAARDPRKRNYR